MPLPLRRLWKSICPVTLGLPRVGLLWPGLADLALGWLVPGLDLLGLGLDLLGLAWHRLACFGLARLGGFWVGFVPKGSKSSLKSGGGPWEGLGQKIIKKSNISL